MLSCARQSTRVLRGLLGTDTTACTHASSSPANIPSLLSPRQPQYSTTVIPEGTSRKWYLLPAAVTVLLGASQVFAAEGDGLVQDGLREEECVQRLLQIEGIKVTHSAGQMLRKHGIIGRLMAQDHWFDSLDGEQMVKEMLCLYDKGTRRFYCCVRVGRDVCGYPRTVHGGLTAAIVDETFGGLYVCLWAAGVLGLITPGLTARLEVNYKRKLAADTVIICTTELESISGRKVWMVSSVQDGRRGVECATARALFVAPGWRQVLSSLLPWQPTEPPSQRVAVGK